MKPRLIITDYLQAALRRAVYQKLEDGTYAGRIPVCKGVLAFASTLTDCKLELRSTLEDWLWLGLKLGHPFPKIGSIDLNRKVKRRALEAV